MIEIELKLNVFLKKEGSGMMLESRRIFAAVEIRGDIEIIDKLRALIQSNDDWGVK